MNKNRFLLAGVGAVFALMTAVAFGPTFADQPHGKGAAPHWGYEGADGPSAWGKLESSGGHELAFPTCAIGKEQSPVDLGKANAIENIVVSTSYNPGPLVVEENSHTVQATAPAGSTLTSDGKVYQLVQVHFHSPSEHTIAGKSFPLEAHFVHKNDKGELAVLGVLFKHGNSNSEIEKILRERQGDNYDSKIGHMTFDPNGLLPKNLKVYHYRGSLTTPPCSEGVNWHVAVEPMTVSADEPPVFETYMHGKNARPVQALNSRQLSKPQ